MLRTIGFRLIRLVVVAEVGRVLGDPDEESEWAEDELCLGDRVRTVRWGDLGVVFEETDGTGRFGQWYAEGADDPEGLVDAFGLGVGATVGFLEVTYANGDREVLFFKDFASGAMIENIVARAKKKAVKRFIDHQERGIRLEDLHDAVREEFKENEDLPNTTNPDDWARISGRKGERIINVRTLITGISRKERTIENIDSGQYV